MGVDATFCCSLFANHDGGSSSMNNEDDKPAEFSSTSLDLAKSNASICMEIDVPDTAPTSPNSMVSPPSKHQKREILKDVSSAANCPLSGLETAAHGATHVVNTHKAETMTQLESGKKKNLQSVKSTPLPGPETPSHITRIATQLTVDKARRDEEENRKRKADMVESIRAEIGGEGGGATSPSVVKAVKVYREMVRAQDAEEAHTQNVDSKMASIKAHIQPEKEGSSPSVSKLVQSLSARKMHQQTSSRDYQIEKARSIAAEIEAARHLSKEMEDSNTAAKEQPYEEGRASAKKQRIQEERTAAEEQRIQEERGAAEEQRVQEQIAAAEEQRIQEERAAAEEQRVQEQRAAAEEQRVQEQRVAAEEQRIQEEKAAAEEQRIQEERAAAEEQRVQEQRAVVEEQRIHEQRAAAEEQRVQEQRAAAEEQRIQEERAAAEEQRIQERRAAAEEQCKYEGATAEKQRIREQRAAAEKQRYEEEKPHLTATNVQQDEQELRRIRKVAESKRLLEQRAFKNTLTKGVTLIKYARNGKFMQRTLKWKSGNDELGLVGWGSGWHSLSDCTEVRRGTDLDPLTDGKKGTATLNACIEGQKNLGQSFSLIFPDRTLDFSTYSKEQCNQLVYQFRSLLRSIS